MTSLSKQQVAFARAQMDALHAQPVNPDTAVCCPLCHGWASGLWHKQQDGTCVCYACSPEDEKQKVAVKRAEALIELGRMPMQLAAMAN